MCNNTFIIINYVYQFDKKKTSPLYLNPERKGLLTTPQIYQY